VPFFWLKTGLVLVELRGLGPQVSFICFLNCTHTPSYVARTHLHMCTDEQLFPWCLQQKARQVQQAHPARDRNDTQAPTALFKDLIWHYPLPHWEQKITSQGA